MNMFMGSNAMKIYQTGMQNNAMLGCYISIVNKYLI